MLVAVVAQLLLVFQLRKPLAVAAPQLLLAESAVTQELNHLAGGDQGAGEASEEQINRDRGRLMSWRVADLRPSQHQHAAC